MNENILLFNIKLFCIRDNNMNNLITINIFSVKIVIILKKSQIFFRIF